MKKKLKKKEDFSINPDYVVKGDFVVKGDKSVNLIGEVGDQIKTSNKMLQFWVKWLQKGVSATPELASNLHKVSSPLVSDYLGLKTPLGVVRCVVLCGKKIKYQILTDELKTPRLLTEIELNQQINEINEQSSVLTNITTVEVEEKADLTYEEQQERLFLERKVEAAFYKAGQALKALRDKKLYRSTHPTFEAYCQDRFGFKRRHPYRLIQASEIFDRILDLCPDRTQSEDGEISPNDPKFILPSSEWQIRALNTLKPEEQGKAWLKAVESADGKAPSGAKVKSIVEQIKERVKSPNPFEVGEISRIVAGNTPELKGKAGQWVVIQAIHEFSCSVNIYQGEFVIDIDNLIKKDYVEGDRLFLSHLCDRLHMLYLKGIDDAGIAFIDRIAKFRRSYLTDLEEQMLQFIEQFYKNIDND